MKITKFDVLKYITENEIEEKKQLLGLIRRNIKFEGLKERTLKEKIRELRKDGILKEFQVNRDNTRTYDYLAFIYWMNFMDVNIEEVTKQNCKLVFKEILNHGEIKIETLLEFTGLSRPTVSKYINILTENNFVRKKKEKPIILEPLINDRTLFYINLFEVSLSTLSSLFSIPNLKESVSGIKDKISEMHSYSTTVTEGNTATPEDVHKVLGNFKTNLTPKEIYEIKNSYNALEELKRYSDESISVNKIKELHEVLMKDLVESPGKFKYGRKRIIGSEFQPPNSKYEIEFSLYALKNFIEKYSSELELEILGALAHFLFVSIHPFEDGNGRMGRLLHSWILMKEGKPAFIYDPNERDEYRKLLEEGNKEDLRDFIQFCLGEHKRALEEIKKD